MSPSATNKHGLSRAIPADVKKAVRRAGGFGCVICGSAIYQYEHVDPVFEDATCHEATKIALLCGACHDKVTRGMWSKERVLEGMRHPKALEVGFSRFDMEVAEGSDFTIRVGQTTFRNLRSIIQIDGVDILSIDPPEEKGAPPRISARFFDRKSVEIASIVENEWRGSTESFDIETTGRRFKIRSAERQIDLLLEVRPPSMLILEQMNLHFAGKTIQGSSDQGFEVVTGSAQVRLPADSANVEKAPHWLKVTNEAISVGSDSVMKIFSESGQRTDVPGAFNVTKGSVEWVDPRENGGTPPPGWREGQKVMRVTGGTTEPGTVSITIPLSKIQKGMSQVHSTVPFHRLGAKVGRNDPCPCKSGKKFKRCCWKD